MFKFEFDDKCFYYDGNLSVSLCALSLHYLDFIKERACTVRVFTSIDYSSRPRAWSWIFSIKPDELARLLSSFNKSNYHLSKLNLSKLSFDERARPYSPRCCSSNKRGKDFSTPLGVGKSWIQSTFFP